MNKIKGDNKKETLTFERLLTPAEVADILRRPVKSIYELISARKIIAVQDGRRFNPHSQVGRG